MKKELKAIDDPTDLSDLMHCYNCAIVINLQIISYLDNGNWQCPVCHEEN